MRKQPVTLKDGWWSITEEPVSGLYCQHSTASSLSGLGLCCEPHGIAQARAGLGSDLFIALQTLARGASWVGEQGHSSAELSAEEGCVRKHALVCGHVPMNVLYVMNM